MDAETSASASEDDLLARLVLAQRFLAFPASGSPVELKPGELPLPDGWRALGTQLSESAPTRALLESPQGAAQSQGEFGDQLRARGWIDRAIRMRGGFLSATTASMPSNYLAPAQDLALMVMAVERASGGSTILVTVMDTPDLASRDLQGDFSMRRHHLLLQAAMPASRHARKPPCPRCARRVERRSATRAVVAETVHGEHTRG